MQTRYEIVLWLQFSRVLLRSAHVCCQAEDGIRDWSVTGVQTCALPISRREVLLPHNRHPRLAGHSSEGMLNGGAAHDEGAGGEGIHGVGSAHIDHVPI